MAAINEVLASIQNIDDLDKYRESGEKRLRVLRSIVSTLNELSVRDGGIVAARLAEAIDNERKFLVNYAEIMEKAYAKINNDDVDMIADDVEVAAEVEVVAEMEIAAEVEIAADVEVDTDEEADYVNEEVNNQLGLEETFYESVDDTVSTTAEYRNLFSMRFDCHPICWIMFVDDLILIDHQHRITSL